jgi:ribokinase
MRPRLVVIGSANRDLVVTTDRIPSAGETVIGGAFVTAAGGKGANQAVAASRLGAEVWFVGCVGQDAFGEVLATEMEDAGVNTELLRRDPAEPTGVALIGVDRRGENAIIVAPGANHRVGRTDIEAARPAIAAADAVVVQLEIPLETVATAVQIARAAGVRVILNPAPVREEGAVPPSLLSRVDVLTPNEHEAASLLGRATTAGIDWAEASAALREMGVGTVIVTLGEAGCMLADDAGVRAIPAPRVAAIDTTAAGDCFTGALAVALAEGQPTDAAARVASRAAALSVTRLGAQPSLPTRAEVDAFRP